MVSNKYMINITYCGVGSCCICDSSTETVIRDLKAVELGLRSTKGPTSQADSLNEGVS